MAKSIISQGKTTNEAIEKGLNELNVSRDMVDIKVLEEEKRSFYNILAPRVVKVELTVKEEKKVEEKKEAKQVKTNKNEQEIENGIEDVKKFLDKFLSKDQNYNIEVKNYDVYVKINGENLNVLIGYRGENIKAFQRILSSIANKKSSINIRLYLDVAGYKEKRVKTLQELAQKIERTVIRTKKPITLEPMDAYERKIIHTTLQESTKVKTFSKGEEPYRKVVISLK